MASSPTALPPPAPQGGGISLNIAKRGSNDMYLARLFTALQSHEYVINTLDGNTDPRVVPATRECIICVLDDRIRGKLLGKFQEAVRHVQSRTNLDPAQKGELLIEVCQNAVAQVYSYADEYVGLSKVNALIPMCSEPTAAATDASVKIIDDSDDTPDLSGSEIDHEEIIEDNTCKQ